ncbi:MAG: ABC transporter ATP-binding protein [Clostridia bacterium]|nr:ABC transporter ATP-binding protein [Clostridia bacterium]
MLKLFFRYSKGYRFRAVMASLTIALEVVFEVLIPFVLKDVINEGIFGEGGMQLVVEKGLLMIALACISLLCGVLSGWFGVSASTGFATNLRQAIFHKIQDFSFANIDKFSTASLVTRSTTDVTNLQQTFMMGTRMLIRSPMMLVASTIMAATISGDTSVIFAVTLPIMAVFMGLVAIKTYPRFKRMFEKYDTMNRQVQESLIAVRIVKAFVREDYEYQRYAFRADEVRDANVKAEKLLVLSGPMANLILYGSIIATCLVAGNHIIAGDMLVGDMSSFISYIAQILTSVMMITMIFVNIVMSRASAARIMELLTEEIDITDDKADPNLKVPDGSISFQNVSFSYSKDGGNLTLRNINIDIKSGETIGIIGGTGSSKTTFVQLIPRLYDVYDGIVKVGGRDVREYTLKNIRDAVSMVLQKNVLFSGTIEENLRWGDMEADHDEIVSACESAQASGFISEFPDGYDTELGQGGVNVSGGQKQRLCIARALLKHPKIIILDDSTSAVDTATDKKIRDAFKNELSGITTIIIAQRITSVMDADRIIVMHDGEINAIGTHDELMKTSDIYKEVFSSQQKGVA